MKYFLGACAVCVLLGAGCTTSSLSLGGETASDFTPPSGGATQPIPETAGERRLLLATSTDGKTFTPTGKVLTEQGNVPDVVRASDGTLYVYYVGQGIEGVNQDTGAIAISHDDGATWSYHLMQYENWPTDKTVSDPDVVLRDDGTFRLYFTMPLKDAAIKNAIGIGYADSDDGITFTYKGKSLTPGFSVVDSSTFFAEGVWHMYVLDTKDPVQYYATSSDGATFTLTSTEPIPVASDYFISNPLIVEDEVRMFGFGKKGDPLAYFSSGDFVTWEKEGTSMEVTKSALQGGTYLQDITVTLLSDGTYLMVYVTDYGT